MDVDKIRKRYQRNEDTELISNNVGAMDNFIKMLQLHSESKDKHIANIAENFEYINTLAPNFIIFECENKNCGFMSAFKAYEISRDTDMLVASHEFGHGVLSIMNDTTVPENYGTIIANAKQHAIAPENRQYFRDYIQYLSGKTDYKEKRTDAEKGPLSDIISSIFQNTGIPIGTPDNICMFPSSHPVNYYWDEKKKEPILRKIFDEDFANYYALKANNCTQELETLRNLFGDEFIQVLDNELTKASNKLELVKESEIQETTNTPMEQIKNVVVLTKSEDIQNISPLEKETQNINYKSNENMEER